MIAKIARIVPLLFIATAFAMGSPAYAAKPQTYVKSAEIGALGGYDPVSYFANAPAKGLVQFSAAHNGATYHFANAENLAKFKANPGSYAPQYGGYCAWATARGYTAPGDPRYWKIVGGKLYVNYDGGVQKKWEKDIPGFITKANANWPTVLEK
jgi:YHS domain-containing protein